MYLVCGLLLVCLLILVGYCVSLWLVIVVCISFFFGVLLLEFACDLLSWFVLLAAWLLIDYVILLDITFGFGVVLFAFAI